MKVPRYRKERVEGDNYWLDRTRGPESGLLGADAGFAPVAEALVHVAPVLEGALQDRLGHPVEQVADDVADQPLAGRVVEHLADQRARLAPVVVLLVQG